LPLPVDLACHGRSGQVLGERSTQEPVGVDIAPWRQAIADLRDDPDAEVMVALPDLVLPPLPPVPASAAPPIRMLPVCKLPSQPAPPDDGDPALVSTDEPTLRRVKQGGLPPPMSATAAASTSHSGSGVSCETLR
jgi:hypothetical protein